MKKSVRCILAATILMSATTFPGFATVSGTNPHPQVNTISYSSLVMSGILSALGF